MQKLNLSIFIIMLLFLINSLTLFLNPANATNTTYGPTKTNEIVWNIATKIRPDPSLNREQVMIALLKENPNSFQIPCNINSLKIGQILNIPSIEKIQTISPTEARTAIRQQNQAWQDFRKKKQPIICPIVETPLPTSKMTQTSPSEPVTTTTTEENKANIEKPIIKVGVLAKRGNDDSVEMWQPTVEYLTQEIPEYRFQIVPLSFTRIYQAVARGEIDFVIANSGMYVEFEARYSVNRIATLKNLRIDKSYTVFGGVIFRKSSRTDIQTLMDFRGKTFMAVDETSMGGWWAAWREFQSVGVHPQKDFKSLTFGGTHDAVVYAVRDGLVDGGTVRTDTLERMSAENKINLEDFTIINPQNQYVEGFSFLLSTRLYPEWPFATLKHTPTLLAKKVAIALLKMPEDSLAARASKSKGWTIPLNYETIHQCFKELHVPPYESFGKITLTDLIQNYFYWVVTVIGSFFILALATIFFQQRAIAQRRRVEKILRQSESQSKDYARLLEIAVDERTAELARANGEITILYERLKIENLRMSTELEVTRRLQQMILPKDCELNQIEGLEISGFMQPATEVGGDYYDVLQYEKRIKIAIGDVTGHGLESGVLAIMVQTAVRTLLDCNETDPVRILNSINRTIYDNVRRMNSDKCLTLIILDYEAGVLRLSGQHEEVIVVKNGEIELIDTMDLGFPIGLEANIEPFIAAADILLNVGDVVVLYTDGITEAENAAGEFYGLERLCRLVKSNWQQSCLYIKQTIINDVSYHIGQHKVFDDITLLVLKQK